MSTVGVEPNHAKKSSATTLKGRPRAFTCAPRAAQRSSSEAPTRGERTQGCGLTLSSSSVSACSVYAGVATGWSVSMYEWKVETTSPCVDGTRAAASERQRPMPAFLSVKWACSTT